MEFEITRLGERGQIVIPLAFREHLNLQKGEKFIVLEQEDNIVLKRIKAPTKEEFKDLIKRTHEHARKHSLTEKDLIDAIKRVRSKKNATR
jgi:AbrB family looped-hinge helix DNA binding protein